MTRSDTNQPPKKTSSQARSSENDLEFERSQLLSIFDSINQIIYIADPTTYEILYVNRALRQAFDRDLVGGLCYREFQGLDAPCAFCTNPIILKDTTKEYQWEHHNPLMDRDYMIIDRIIKWPDGRDVRFELAIDITDRIQAQEELRKSEKHLKDLFDSITDLIYTQDTEGRFLSLNAAMSKAFGYTKEELIGTTASDYMKPEMKRLFKTDYLGTLKKKGYHEGVSSYFAKDGKKIYIEYHSSLVTPASGDPYISGTGRDVTERINAERRIRQLQKQMLQAQKMEAVGTLAGGIAHDFNNLLMGIQGRTSLMLMDKDLPRAQFQHLKEIEEHVRSAADLTKQLLAFARGGRYQVESTDLNRLVEKTVQMFARTKKEITIDAEYQSDLWIADVDRTQIEQVLMNLYVNAWQAMPTGGKLTISTQNITLDAAHCKPFDVTPGTYVKLAVTDTGVGMDEKTRQRIFDPFFTTKTMGRGTGLGLATVYGIVKNHKGIIDVKSQRGQGTTFYIYLPAREKQIQDHPETSESSTDLRKGEETILLVDDEEITRDVAAAMLKQLGYRATTADNGQSAIDIYQHRQDHIDLVILDMIMPDLGGGPVYDRLKEINPEVKVLLSSGYSIDGQATDILNKGCNGFIQKPFDLERLSEKLGAILDSG